MDSMENTVGEDTPIDRTARALAAGASRRSVMRGLAAALVATAGGGIASDTLAKKRKKKPKNRPKDEPTPDPRPQSACSEVTTITFLSVPSDGSIVETPVLKKGQIYHLRADGWWGTEGEYAIDAFARFRWPAPSEHTLFDGGVRVGLSVNGNSPDLWGNRPDSYDTSHRYTMAIVGKGDPATLRMVDSDYSENHRLLTVELVCVPI